MCYMHTPYHDACKHYGRKTVRACIRATALRGHRNGCWDPVDLGVENVEGLCARCLQQGGRSSFDSGYGSVESSASSSSVEDARALLSMLPARVPKIQRNCSGVGISRDRSRVLFKGEALGERRNLHWRAFDGRGFVDGDELWP